MSSIDGSRYLAEAFKAYGVTHFFHVPVILNEACKEMQRLGIVPVMTHGEKAAAYMADGYSRISRRVGVCGAQTIGGTNLAAGLRDAYLARVPVLALTGGKMPQSRYRCFYQEIDDMPIFEAITKFNAVVESGERLPDLLDTAFRAATTGMPQPVHLELPSITGGHLGSIESEIPADPRFGRYPAIRAPAPDDDVEKPLQALRQAQRPIIVAGGGVSSSAAGPELLEFARLQGVPVAPTLNAKDTLLDADPLNVGVVGEYSRACANQAVNEADLVIFIGSLTGGLVTRGWTLISAEARIVHIDINPENLGRNYRNTIGVCGDAKAVLRQMLDRGASATQHGARQSWLKHIASLKAQWNEAAAERIASDAQPMRPERLCRELSAFLPPNAILVGDTGHAGAWIAQYLEVTSPGQTFIRAAGSLGWSFPAALGAKCAAPDRPVICFTGDGGFYFHLAEMETAVRYGIPVIVVVNNNQSLNQEQFLWQGTTEFDRNWRFSPVDLAAAASAFGCLGLKVERGAEVRPALEEALAANRPTIIDARTDWRIAAQPSWGPAGSKSMYG